MAVSDEEALLQAIWAEPDDDAPRLVYADWLEENGRPDRAEFIRVQCVLAGSGLTLSQRKRLRARQDELWSAHRQEWLGVLRGSSLPWRFHRGFLERLAKTGYFRAEVWDANTG